MRPRAWRTPSPRWRARRTRSPSPRGSWSRRSWGEEVAAFSVDELTYNETLGDWRTHDGIDIAAEVGTQVIAACSGVVTAVRDDDMMGTLVTIAHDDGYETTYANLRSSPGVGEGQYVSAGEVIGAVGSSSIAEFSMPAHLHFSVSKDGVPCDPAEFLN